MIATSGMLLIGFLKLDKIFLKANLTNMIIRMVEYKITINNTSHTSEDG